MADRRDELSEVVMVPLVLAAVLTALRARNAAKRRIALALAAGVFAGLAWLTRANGFMLLLPLALALWPAAGRRRSARAYAAVVAVVAAALLTIAPWTARNAHVLHRFVPVSTEDGYTLAGTYNPVARAATRYPAAWVEWYRVPQNLRAIRSVPNTEVDWGDALRSRALKEDVQAHPGYVAKVAWWNLRRVFDAAGLGWIRTDLGGYALPRSAAYLELAGFWVVAALALIGAIGQGVRRIPRWVALVPFVLLVPVLIAGYLRFRAPIDPFIAVLAALGLRQLAGRGRPPSTASQAAHAASLPAHAGLDAPA